MKEMPVTRLLGNPGDLDLRLRDLTQHELEPEFSIDMERMERKGCELDMMLMLDPLCSLELSLNHQFTLIF